MTNCLSLQISRLDSRTSLDELALATRSTRKDQAGASAPGSGSITWPYLVLDSLSMQTARAVGRRGEAARRKRNCVIPG